jgi:hypothetical protein
MRLTTDTSRVPSRRSGILGNRTWIGRRALVLTKPAIYCASAAAERCDSSRLADSLDRKITYCLNRPGERLQYQVVEGWSARQVLDRMRAAGIAEERIQNEDLPGARTT